MAHDTIRVLGCRGDPRAERPPADESRPSSAGGLPGTPAGRILVPGDVSSRPRRVMTMRVQYERVGGVGGPAMRKNVTIDTADLPAHEANQLHHLVQKADLAQVARSPAAAPNPLARDQFHYRLTVEDNNQRHCVVVSDPNVPERFQSLINWLHERHDRSEKS